MFNFPALAAIQLVKVEAIVFRVPITEPVQTSFGTMHDRPAVLVRVEDTEGAAGWGEIWCNFPSVGAEHRARLLDSTVAPLLLERKWQRVQDAFDHLSQRMRILAIQCGEPGTIAQVIAGADMALWDLAARRAGQPLWQIFGGDRDIATYASGLSPTAPERLAEQKRDEGYRAFKLKVGFGEQRDVENLRALRNLLGVDTPLMIDANQAWDSAQAIRMSKRLAEFNPFWLEEPVAADTPLAQWRDIADASPIPLAAGENMRGTESFAEAIGSGAFAVIQPDIGKWGGFTGCLAVGKDVLAANRMFCPHWLGGGIGLVASMHLKAAVGGPGYVEVDSNPNPLRDLLAAPAYQPTDGKVTLSDGPGLGVEPDMAAAREFIRNHR